MLKECWWAGWEEWKGDIAPNSCGKQRRYRKRLKSYTYGEKLGSCQGVVKNCPREYDYQERAWCKLAQFMWYLWPYTLSSMIFKFI